MKTIPLTKCEFSQYTHILDLYIIMQAEELYKHSYSIEWPASLVNFWNKQKKG